MKAPSKNLFIPLILVIATGGIATFLLHDLHSSSPQSLDPLVHLAIDQNHRSLNSSHKRKFVYDPKTVLSRVPQITSTVAQQIQFVDDTQALGPYPLHDHSDIISTDNTRIVRWMKERYSDISSCLDYKCTTNAALCDNALQTNYNDSLADGTPPCCTHILRDMLHEFDDSMRRMGLDYFVGFGTLLGLVRSGRVIPWTIDNDMVLESQQDLRVLATLWDVEATGLKVIYPTTSINRPQGPRGFPRMCVTKDFAGGQLKKWEIPTPSDKRTKLPKLFHDRGYPYIDFYFGTKFKHDTWGDEYMRCRHFVSDVFPTKRYAVYDGQFALNFPRDPVAVLKRYYGLNWMVPKRDKSQHGDPSVLCMVNYGLEEPPAPKK